MNLATFRTRISSSIGLDNTNGSAEQALMDSYTNQGVLDLLRKTRCFVDIDNMVLTANDGDYDISTNILELIEVDILPANGGLYPRPMKVGLAEILDRRKLQPLASGVPPQLFCMSGSNLMSFYPVPSGSDTATLYYIPRPTSMSNTADDPSLTAFGGIPAEYHDAIEYYAMWRSADYDDSMDAQNYLKLYQSRFREIRREVQRTGTTHVPRMQIHRRYGRGSRNLGYMPGIDTGSIGL